MTVIKKQKFIAELGRLLTFMYDEDRKSALEMYEKLFDEANDHDALAQLMVSPTRQAVLIARKYDATERRLQVESRHRGEDDEEEALPEYVLTIDRIYQAAVDKGIICDEDNGPKVLENQFSLFEEIAAEEAPAAEEALPEAESEAQPEAEEKSEAEEAAGAEEESKAAETDPVDDFLSDFSIAGEETPAEESPVSEETAAEEAAPAEELPAAKANTEEPEEKKSAPPITVRKAKVFLLLLYIIVAIPVTLVGVALLLIPTLLTLGLSAAVIIVGVAALIAAFSGFAVFADILIVLGAALILLALGVLLLWLFIWFVGVAIVGLIRGAISLGGKWCYKEVPAE